MCREKASTRDLLCIAEIPFLIHYVEQWRFMCSSPLHRQVAECFILVLLMATAMVTFHTFTLYLSSPPLLTGTSCWFGSCVLQVSSAAYLPAHTPTLFPFSSLHSTSPRNVLHLGVGGIGGCGRPESTNAQNGWTGPAGRWRYKKRALTSWIPLHHNCGSLRIIDFSIFGDMKANV
ncbi:hypothetical protein EmuJ_001157100 [Echinococcus multilocularis]|uniref:Uncharacterized protein n=1 Tax=Echinococcus multilocularis TaxID=6211 RepID=A0A068YNR5_ECHMU|nr:hypothetical protein EmuJ_001157100 [Echinococcus multilocularis]